MNTVIKFNSFISILLLFSLIALSALAIHIPSSFPSRPKRECDEIQVDWKSNEQAFVHGLDLYNEKGEFVKSLWKGDSIVRIDDVYSLKVKLQVPLYTPLPAKYMIEIFTIMGK
ncbi:13870_t:CDS:2 [Funneliformis mosseae]|uniref:13870_t:CDS:1 n=1 Tax=Funneliformis mosseae TaxID=27381 RepID=A0A9N8VDT0_FUNMO|nr:13870_t:CDS:2 [Funneliformis mosseae]